MLSVLDCRNDARMILFIVSQSIYLSVSKFDILPGGVVLQVRAAGSGSRACREGAMQSVQARHQ